MYCSEECDFWKAGQPDPVNEKRAGKTQAAALRSRSDEIEGRTISGEVVRWQPGMFTFRFPIIIEGMEFLPVTAWHKACRHPVRVNGERVRDEWKVRMRGSRMGGRRGQVGLENQSYKLDESAKDREVGARVATYSSRISRTA
jgi:hypothetical protein